MEIKAAVIQLRNFWKMSFVYLVTDFWKMMSSVHEKQVDSVCHYFFGVPFIILVFPSSFFVFFLGLTKCIIIMIIVIFSLLLKEDMRYLHVIGGRYITSWKFLGHACMIEGCCLCVIFIYFYFPIYLQFNQCVMLRVLLA